MYVLYHCTLYIDPTEGVPTDNSIVYGVLYEDITLRFYYNLSGNPAPITNWTLNGTPITLTGGKYESLYPTALNITNVTGNEYGIYNATTTNGIGNEITAIINLIQASTLYIM